jgi:hypothetical protein
MATDPNNPQPDGIPDPNNPGYDTNGNPMGRTSPITATHGGTTGSGAPAGTTAGNVGQPVAPTPTGGGPGTGNYPALATSLFGAMPAIPHPPAFDYAPFAPPSANDILTSDPGFAFREQQGLGALQNSAAARGVLNTGGTLKDLIDYGQNSASQEYGNAFNRALGGYVTNFGNALTKYNTNYGTQYLNPYNQAFQQYQQGVGNQGQIFGQQFSTATA